MIHWSPCTQHTILLRIKTTFHLLSYLQPYLCNAIIFLHRRRLPPWNETSDTIISKAGTIDDVNQTQHTASSAMMFTVFSNTISVQIHQDTTWPYSIGTSGEHCNDTCQCIIAFWNGGEWGVRQAWGLSYKTKCMLLQWHTRALCKAMFTTRDITLALWTVGMDANLASSHPRCFGSQTWSIGASAQIHVKFCAVNCDCIISVFSLVSQPVFALVSQPLFAPPNWPLARCLAMASASVSLHSEEAAEHTSKL